MRLPTLSSTLFALFWATSASATVSIKSKGNIRVAPILNQDKADWFLNLYNDKEEFIVSRRRADNTIAWQTRCHTQGTGPKDGFESFWFYEVEDPKEGHGIKLDHCGPWNGAHIKCDDGLPCQKHS